MEVKGTPDPGLVDAAAGESPGSMSSLQAVFGVFLNPRRTFAAMAAKPRFLLPLVILVLTQLVFGVLITQSGAVKTDSVAKMEAKGAPAEQIAGMEKFFDSPAAPVVVATTGAVTVVFILLVSAALMLFMANLMLGARLTFKHYLSIAAYSSLIGIIDQIVQGGLAWSSGTLDVRLGLGNLLGEELGLLGRVVDTATNPVILWATAVSALGVGVLAKKGFGFGLATVLPGFVLGLLLSGMR